MKSSNQEIVSVADIEYHEFNLLLFSQRFMGSLLELFSFSFELCLCSFVKSSFFPHFFSFFVDVFQLRSRTLSSLFKHVFLLFLIYAVTEVNFLILAYSHNLANFSSMCVVDIQCCIVVQIKFSNCVL